MSRPRVAFRPALLANLSGNDDATNRNFRDLARAIEQLQQEAAAVAASSSSRVYVSTVTGVGPWNFSGMNGDEVGLLGYEFELSIVDQGEDLAMRLNGDSSASYGDTAAHTLARIATNPGGPPGFIRGVVGLRGVATGQAKAISVADVTCAETVTPTTALAPRNQAYVSTTVVTSASFFHVFATPADASSSVKLFKIMQV